MRRQSITLAKMRAKIRSRNKDELVTMARILAPVTNSPQNLVFDLVLDQLMKVMDEKEFIELCDSLEGDL